jgi:large subunit ribosomal protein L23
MNYANVIRAPRITEKATALAEHNVYTFDIDVRTTKSEVVKAMKALYKITPVKIAVSTIKPKVKLIRGKVGTIAGGKKAYVYLKKGDTLNLFA